MLTHRTNLLLSKNEYETVKRISKRKKKSVGFVIRDAINKTYKIDAPKTQAEILTELRDIFKNVDTKGINYKEMISEGRRF